MALTTTWFICPYKRRIGDDIPSRYCAMDDFTPQIIQTDGGYWSETEVLGNRAIVKVKAEPSTIATIAGTAGFKRLPKDLLNSPLSDLTQGQKTALKDEILDMGYTSGELSAWFGNDGVNIGNFTLKDVLKKMATRRLKPRYDSGTDTIVLDGAVQPVKTIDKVDSEV